MVEKLTRLISGIEPSTLIIGAVCIFVLLLIFGKSVMGLIKRIIRGLIIGAVIGVVLSFFLPMQYVIIISIVVFLLGALYGKVK